MNYRERIKNVREDHDLTQTQVGKLLDKSQQGYNHIEMGRAELKIDDLIRLCKFYDLSADYLIGLTDNPISYKNEKMNRVKGRSLFEPHKPDFEAWLGCNLV